MIPRQSFTRQRLHFALKSGGSDIEALQLETRERLERAVTLYSVVAWKLLWMTYQVRRDPDQDPSVAFSPTQNRGVGTRGRHPEPAAAKGSTPDPAGRGARDGQTRRISGPEA